MSAGRNFISGEELTPDELGALLQRADELKAGRDRGEGSSALAGRTVALFFEKPSTRTRVSFQVGVAELGGNPLPLRQDEMQLGRGESIGDTARVLSRFVHCVAIRSGSDATVDEFAEAAEVPVINMLTPSHHPCQAIADLQTLRERFGRLEGLKVAYVGDGNNVARSLALLGRMVGVEVVVAAPEGFQLEDGVAAAQTTDPAEAARGADAIYTDVWVSMGDDEAEAESKREALNPYRIDSELIALAAEGAIALHCLPAHPGEEITAEVLYGKQSAVFDQAENRLHAQKALMELLLNPS
ncbi:ornithine carbamoyltransferase [soil metagenome]